MKWYSTKKFKPSIKHCMYVVRLTNGRIYIATLEGDEENFTWISDDGKYFDDYAITHFINLDPLEIEND